MFPGLSRSNTHPARCPPSVMSLPFTAASNMPAFRPNASYSYARDSPFASVTVRVCPARSYTVAAMPRPGSSAVT
ncbi:hypothetical protein EDD34_2345 [Myceligenerans xiligouense]|uniref:Uncharacterized protein n=1 Tax=Myceligenerans xiligouense TaxID=253184 RepID=A0A3N4ZPE9_9MICO|nr:hypothetical protein EDD34_2345 [Myceligenerans xiligouense]